jgi:hypothetical protein
MRSVHLVLLLLLSVVNTLTGHSAADEEPNESLCHPIQSLNDSLIDMAVDALNSAERSLALAQTQDFDRGTEHETYIDNSKSGLSALEESGDEDFFQRFIHDALEQI